MENMLTQTLGSTIKVVVDRWAAQTSDSYLDYNRVSRVEATVLVDQMLNGDPNLMPILETVHSFFTSQYLRANAISCTVGKVNIRNHLDRLNPNRKPGDLASMSDSYDAITGSMESYKHRLPALGNKLAMEAEERDRQEAIVNMRDNQKAMIENTNFIVGKDVSIEIVDGSNSATLMANISLSINYVTAAAVAAIYGDLAHPKTAKERAWGWKVGSLKFVRDILFCCDALDELRERSFSRDYKTASRLMLTKYKNQMAGFLTGNPSIATCSAILILDSSTAQALELKAGGKLDHYDFRQKLFKETTLMTMVIVDREWNSATFYHRNIEASSEVPFASMESAAKKQNFSITDILKSYSAGRSPVI